MTISDLYKIFERSSGVATDTRAIIGNELFFALKGDKFDGNVFVKSALEKGASYVVCDDPIYEGVENVICTSSALLTLQELAGFHRRKLGHKVIAVTGSNGKTTTKELLACVLSEKYSVYATKGNFNNHIGVPLTLLSAKNEEIIIVEMGANHHGEIAGLCEIVRPNFGLITNIGKAHLEGFGDLNGVRRAKGELFDYLSENDCLAIVNTADPILKEMAEERKLKVFPYGDDADVKVKGELLSAQCAISGSFTVDGRKQAISSKMTGAYNFQNIMAAVSVGVYFGVEMHSISQAITSYIPENNRSQLLKGKSNILTMDAYNANPSSMFSALENFLSESGEPKMLILGDMLELGDVSLNEHRNVLAYLKHKKVQEVVLVGLNFYKFSENMDYSFQFFKSIESCRVYLEQQELSGFSILLKGSRGIALESLSELLLK